MSKEDYLIDINQYEQGGKIGQGSFSMVFKVKDINSGELFAGKILNKEIIDNDLLDNEDNSNGDIKGGDISLQREINFLYFFNHPSILKLIGYSSTSFEESTNPIIITELASTSLEEVLNLERLHRSPNGWDFTKKYICIYGISLGLSFMHSNKIIHRDLKPENILMNEKLYPKISDFGLSKTTTPITKSLDRKSDDGFKGTHLYSAPEAYDNKCTFQSDVYSFALICYEILNGKKPFDGYKYFDLMKAKCYNEIPKFEEDVPVLYQNLIIKCLSPNPDDRPTIENILNEIENSEDFRKNALFDEKEFDDYLEYVRNSKKSFDSSHPIHFKDIKKRKKHELRKVVEEEKINEIDNNNNNDVILPENDVPCLIEPKKQLKLFHFKHKNSVQFVEFPINEFEKLNPECQNLVLKARTNPQIQFIVGRNLIEGNRNFPRNIEIGVKYLLSSITYNCIDSLIYYCQMLYEGRFIPKNVDLSKKYLKKNLDDSRVLLLYGRISQKENDLSKAKDSYKKSAQMGNIEAMYRYGKMLFKGEGCKKNIDLAIKYFQTSQNSGYEKSQQFLNAYMKLKNLSYFNELDEKIQFLFILKVIKKERNNVKFDEDGKNVVKDKWRKIEIEPNETEKLYLKELFSSPNFIIFLNNFYSINIYIDYPSEHFISIYGAVSELKLKKMPIITISVVIKDGETKITKNCFDSLTMIKNILIPSSINYIDIFAFKDCTSLTQISIPSSVTEIHQNAFENCQSLKEVSILSNLTYLGDYLFKGCISLKHIIIPKSVIYIGNNCFDGCTSLEAISIPRSVTYIGSNAFLQCKSLKRISIPKSVQYIGSNAFESCSSLELILIPSTMKKIESSSFNRCSSLKLVSKTPSQTSFGEFDLKPISSASMISFVIPSFITLIGSNAFSRCSSLTKIEIPTSITEICESAFKGCFSLKQIVFDEPSSIFSIGDYAFSGCSSLTEISIPSSVTEIKKEAFICCTSLLKVSFCNESSITSIGDYAFFKCGKLEEVSIPPSVEKIGIYAFGDCKSLKKVVILSFIHEIGEKSFSDCSSLSQVIFNSNCEINESHSSSIGNYAFSGCEELKEISIPSFVSKIGDAVFQNCSRIVSIKFESPSSLVSIGSSFCEGCSSLETISIPSSVKSIGLSSFQNCSSLKKIELPSIMKKEFSKYLKGMNHKIKINYI